MGKIIILGLDGASDDQLRSVIKMVNLPNLQKLVESGISYPLRSIYPYVTAPAWASAFSGVNPGKHGVYDLLEYTASEAVIPNYRNSKVPFLWDYLSWAGKKLIVAGMPCTYPAPAINGVFITGRFVPYFSCFPSELTKEINLNGYDYSPLKFQDDKKRVESILDKLQLRIEASLYLLDSKQYDVAVFVDSLPDAILHKHYWENDLICKLFSIFDSWIGSIFQRMSQDDRLIVFSDHGFGEVHTVVNINDWLRRKGYIKDSKIIRFVKRRFFNSNKKSQFAAKKVKVNGWPSGKPKPIPVPPRNASAFAFGVESMSWIKVLNGNCFGKLLEDLHELKDCGVVRNILLTDKLYWGKETHKVPAQLLIEPVDGVSINPYEYYSGSVVRKLKNRKSAHRRTGILVISTRSSQKISQGEASILDLTPTVLKMLSLPEPTYLDGKPLNII